MSRTVLATRQLPTHLLRHVHTSQGKLNSTPTAPSDLHVESQQMKPLVADVLPPPATAARPDAPLSRLPAKNLVRSLFLTSFMTRRWLLRPTLAALGFICNTKMPLFSVETNPLLNRLLRRTLYDHYAAGNTLAEVTQTTGEVKGMGFHGVIIGHTREVVLENPSGGLAVQDDAAFSLARERVVEAWKDEQLLTLKMIGKGDYLAIKLSGAGDLVSDALRAGKPMPTAVALAMDEICDAVREQGSRVWLDAEQQAFQPTLDEWAIQLMRKHNNNKTTDKPVLYNTIQAYLKGARANAARHVQLAAEEGWTVAIKLVRGAYIENEVRSLIHDTKEDTDQSYNDIATMLISQTMPSESTLPFPRSALFLATHNAESIELATATYQQRKRDALPTVLSMECGQVLGMADELGCSLLQRHEDSRAAGEPTWARPLDVYKCSVRGTVAEALHYLYRRAVENRGAVERTEHMQRALTKELRRRVFG